MATKNISLCSLSFPLQVLTKVLFSKNRGHSFDLVGPTGWDVLTKIKPPLPMFPTFIDTGFNWTGHWWLNTLYVHTVEWLLKIKNKHDVINWKHFPRYWPFVRGIHRSPKNSPHKGRWRGVLILSLICVWKNGWANNREAGDLRRYHTHYDVIIISKAKHDKIRYPVKMVSVGFEK